MDKFIIIIVYDATPKNPQKIHVKNNDWKLQF